MQGSKTLSSEDDGLHRDRWLGGWSRMDGPGETEQGSSEQEAQTLDDLRGRGQSHTVICYIYREMKVQM